MKKILGVITAIVITISPVLSQQPVTSPPAAPPPVSPANTSAPHLSADELAKLAGPIALYPDPMISLILPASTVPSDIVMAARYLRDSGDPNQIDQQNWDPSVKGLARYPDVINMMNQNLDWTNQLGAAVIAQQPDVMAAIQTERVKAHDLGNLQTTPQQQVVVQDQVIQVVPADPQVIYVPTYDPAVVYEQPAPVAGPLITFGAGLALGAWIGGGCDWWHGGIWNNGCWGSGGWNNSVNINNSRNINFNGNNNNWHPNNNRPGPRPPFNPNRPGGGGSGTQFPGFKPAPPGGWSGGNNRPGGNTPNNRPGGNGSGTWNGNKPGGKTPNNRPGGGGNNPNFKPGGGGNNPAVRPGAGGSGTQNKALKPAGGSSQNPKKSAPNSQRPGADTPQRKVPDFGGGSNRSLQERSKPSRPAGGGFQRPAGGGGGGGGFRGGGGGGHAAAGGRAGGGGLRRG